MLLRASTSPRQPGHSRQAEEFAPAASADESLAIDRGSVFRNSQTRKMRCAR